MKKVTYILFAVFLTFNGLKAQTLTQKVQIAFAKFSTDEQLKYASFSLTVLNLTCISLIEMG
jgi:hypothetical protein